MYLHKSLKELLEQFKWKHGGQFPQEVHVGHDFHPDIGYRVKSMGPRFLINTIHSVPFYADPDLKKNEVRVVTATGEEKVVKI
jgi:hypothetical protein